jgi:hypothetical protein
LVLTVIISSIFVSCTSTLATRAIEDSDDGSVLVIESDKVVRVVENWGLQNGFEYVAYRRISTGTSTESSIYGNQYGVYGSSNTVYYSRVLVMGIDNIDDVPPKFNVAIVPPKPHKEMTAVGMILLVSGITVVSTLFLAVVVFPAIFGD